LSAGRALDLACGRGANSLFLAEAGYSVDAIDISSVVMAELRDEATRRNLKIDCIVADLDHYSAPENAYDLIIVFYFFSDRMIPHIKRALKPEGLLFYATYNKNHTSVHPTFNPAYLIDPSALGDYFSEYEILVHEPEVGESANISRIICWKPAILRPAHAVF
jgi:tellurite methyltransferase